MNKNFLSFIFRAVALALGVAGLVLLTINKASTEEILWLLCLSVTILSFVSINEYNQKKK